MRINILLPCSRSSTKLILYWPMEEVSTHAAASRVQVAAGTNSRNLSDSIPPVLCRATRAQERRSFGSHYWECQWFPQARLMWHVELSILSAARFGIEARDNRKFLGRSLRYCANAMKRAALSVLERGDTIMKPRISCLLHMSEGFDGGSA